MEQPAGDANNHRGFTQAYAAYTGHEIDKATSALYPTCEDCEGETNDVLYPATPITLALFDCAVLFRYKRYPPHNNRTKSSTTIQ